MGHNLQLGTLVSSATLAGMADDSGGDSGRLCDSGGDGGRPCRGRRTALGGLAGDSESMGGKTLALAGTQALGGRLWRTTLRNSGRTGMRKSLAHHTLAGTPGKLWRLATRAWHLWRGQLHGRHGGRLWRCTARTPARTTLHGVVTHHSDVFVGLPGPTLQRLFCASVARRSGRSRARQTRSIPASGGCEWVPRYEHGATHDHSMHGWGAPWHCDTP